MASANLPFILLLLVLSTWLVCVKRENKIVPIIVAMCFLPADVSLYLGGMNFQAVRLLAIVGIINVYTDSNRIPLQSNVIDRLFIAYNLIWAISYILASVNTSGAVVNQAGQLVDSIALYIFFRNIIQTQEDIEKIAKVFSICILLLVPFIISEFFFTKNLFSIVGRSIIEIRFGEIRAAGCFSHSILFGSFSAAIIPILWAYYKNERKARGLLAVFACLFYVYACSSSGPIVCLAGILFFLSFFKFKNYSKELAWGMFLVALFIHFVRESPLWHFLYLRITVKASSTGLHRYLLMEAAVKEFWDWWLIGYGDIGPDWHEKYWPWAYANFTDVTNHYLITGVRGGGISMFVFMILCYKSIKVLGNRAIRETSLKNQWLWWGFNVMMIGHCITFLSVAYFGQITMLLYLTIAVAAYAQSEYKAEV